MNFNPTGPVTGILISLFACGPLLAAPGDHTNTPAGFLAQRDSLPPGRLKTRIDKLPAAAQQRAVEWLQRFDIPAQDYDYLQVDPDGGILYSDTELPDPEAVTADPEAAADPLAVAPEETFFLHSRPGASMVVFLDFDGHVISGTAWNSSSNTLYAKSYDTDGNTASFSTSERAQIAEIWHRIAEDMAPFNIDVTTEDPGEFGPTTGHVLITSTVDETGAAMPYNTGGGVAYVGVWGRSNYTSYQPALVYFNRLGGGHPPYVAEAASHEFGHNLGLSHDGTSSTGYYQGHGAGFVSWAPVMGVGYYNNVTQWSKGEYADANNPQDDLSIIGGQLGYRADDHGDTLGAATALAVDADGLVYMTSPEVDPQNLDTANKGVIETRDDTDLFWFDTAAGPVNLTVTPAWEAFYRSSRRGSNLDVRATLYDTLGNVVASSDPLDETSAQIITAQLAAGRYYLAVSGVDNAQSPYSDYGSLGMYFVSGSVQPAAGDTTAPNPNGWWASAPSASGTRQINMTASTASDDSGVVQYWFQCSASTGSGCSGSGWQSSTDYSAADLSPATYYSYQVKMRDASGNETGWSPMLGTTTDSNQLPDAVADAVTTGQDQSILVAVLLNDSDPDGDSLAVASFGQAGNGTVTQSGERLMYTPNTGFNGSDTFIYTVTDGLDVSEPASVSVTVMSGNSAPVAVDDTASVQMNSSVSISVLSNDTDADGDSLSILDWSQGGKGSVALSSDGTKLVYSRGSRKGGDSFTYRITDGQSVAQATVLVSLGSGSTGGGGGGKCHPKKGC